MRWVYGIVCISLGQNENVKQNINKKLFDQFHVIQVNSIAASHKM